MKLNIIYKYKLLLHNVQKRTHLSNQQMCADRKSVLIFLDFKAAVAKLQQPCKPAIAISKSATASYISSQFFFEDNKQLKVRITIFTSFGS